MLARVAGMVATGIGAWWILLLVAVLDRVFG